MILDEWENWKLVNADCIEHMYTMPAQCIDFSVYSPPFPSVFAYSDSARDLGNSEDMAGDGKLHLGFFYKAIARLLKPGRSMVVHVAQIHRLKRSGEEGVFDFRGLNIRMGQRCGLIYEYDWVVRKNPQMQALRTKKWELKFQGLETDRAQSRGAMPDYLIKFRAPGVNAVPVDSKGEVSRNDWIEWAESSWNNITETDTLNVKKSKGEDDTKHIAPLQLGVIERLVRLYTNPGEIVFSPFTGIGSEGFVSLGGVSPKTKRSIKTPRRFYGVELKPEYYQQALLNLARAERECKAENRSLFESTEAAI